MDSAPRTGKNGLLFDQTGRLTHRLRQRGVGEKFIQHSHRLDRVRRADFLGANLLQQRPGSSPRLHPAARVFLIGRGHRSHSPITKSSDPKIATVSLIMCPGSTFGRMLRFTNDGARIFIRYGVPPPRLLM